MVHRKQLVIYTMYRDFIETSGGFCNQANSLCVYVCVCGGGGKSNALAKLSVRNHKKSQNLTNLTPPQKSLATGLLLTLKVLVMTIDALGYFETG